MRVTLVQSALLSGLAGFILGVSVSMLYGMQQFCAVSPTAARPARELRNAEETRCVSKEQLQYLTKVAQSAVEGFANASMSSWKTSLIAQRKSVTMPPASDIQALREFLFPKDQIRQRRKGTPVGEPKLLSEEYGFKHALFVGVMTSEKYLTTRAKVVYDTWGQEVDKLVFFVGEDCRVPSNLSHLPIIALSGVPDNVYPPLKKAFAVMQYMYDNFVNGYNWFVRADDDMYVRGKKLKQLLQSLNHNEKIYLGRAGTGRSEDLKRLNLMPYERYCMGGPGVMFSSATIRGIGPHLSTCLQAITFHDQHMKEDQEWNDDDVEIGRCISRKLDVQCSTSAESRYYFHFDYHGNILNAMSLWTKPEYQDLVSVHPVKDPDNMRAIHLFFKTLEFESLQDQLYDMSQGLNGLCKSLPVHLLPPPLASQGSCELRVLTYKNGYSGWNSMGEIKGRGSYLVKKEHVPYFHNPMDEHELLHWNNFNSYFINDLSALTPQHYLYPSFRAELEYMFGLVESYINSKHQGRVTLADIQDGYVRYNHRAGPEYIMTLKFTKEDRKDSPLYHRVRLLRPLQPAIYVMDEMLPAVTINVILPVKAVDDHFREFMTMFTDSASNAALRLVVVVFSLSDRNAAELTVSQELQRTHVAAEVTVVVNRGVFDWTTAVESGMSLLKNPDDLAFTADVDLRIRPRFWNKCLANSIHGNRIYFPIVFRMYNTDYRYVPNGLGSAHYWNGHWAPYSHKHYCVYKSDYDAIGGYTSSSDFGDLYERAREHNLEVLQAPDATLHQVWDSSSSCDSLVKSPQGRYICQTIKKSASLEQVDIAEFLSKLNGGKHKPFKFAADRHTEMEQ